MKKSTEKIIVNLDGKNFANHKYFYGVSEFNPEIAKLTKYGLLKNDLVDKFNLELNEKFNEY